MLGITKSASDGDPVRTAFSKLYYQEKKGAQGLKPHGDPRGPVDPGWLLESRNFFYHPMRHGWIWDKWAPLVANYDHSNEHAVAN
ncbi:hypothetical protein GOBAR_AA27231 [Gossypium barbadense]|uniref:Uncharacterized protein n=1 Tax=Gossypium barbadense TaxID=3634 RepID=A0A2P5WQR4_GOSBA|nr:hypothetical protein GOBAR_AA27231 [Gossypium barbadense]